VSGWRPVGVEAIRDLSETQPGGARLTDAFYTHVVLDDRELDHAVLAGEISP
jgi:hypothetical protein